MLWILSILYNEILNLQEEHNYHKLQDEHSELRSLDNWKSTDSYSQEHKTAVTGKHCSQSHSLNLVAFRIHNQDVAATQQPNTSPKSDYKARTKCIYVNNNVK